MAAIRIAFDGHPFVGLFAKASDRLALIPRSSPPKFEEAAHKLGVSVVKSSVDASAYLGVYTAMNSHGLIIPPFCTPQEHKDLASGGLPVHALGDSRFSAVANNIACNDKRALVNPDMPRKDVEMIGDALQVEVVAAPIEDYKTVGMMVVATNKGWVAHNRIGPDTARRLTELFGVEGLNATVNSGTPVVGLGLTANSYGALIGEATTGFELSRVEQALDIV